MYLLDRTINPEPQNPGPELDSVADFRGSSIRFVRRAFGREVGDSGTFALKGLSAGYMKVSYGAYLPQTKMETHMNPSLQGGTFANVDP